MPGTNQQPMPNPAVPLPPSSHPVHLGRIRIGHLG